MKYSGMPQGMWLLFRNSFRRKLTTELSYDNATAHAICKKAKEKYKEIIGRLPEFEKKDRFKMNIVSCAMLSAFILSMPKKHTTEEMTTYYRESMMTGAMRWFCKKSDKKEIHRTGYPVYEGDRRVQSRRQKPVFVEYGLLPL